MILLRNISRAARLRTTIAILAVTLAAHGAAMAQSVDILTFHGDSSRIGWNARETELTPATVSQATFGKLWQMTTDGVVAGSPLYLSGVTIGGRKTDVVFAATMQNSVYAADAVSGHMLWSRRHLVSPVTNLEYWGGRGQGNVGIYSTPVIDRATGTLYACGVHRKGLRQVHLVWALDVHTGETRPGWPITLKGEYKGLKYAAGESIQRGALTLLDGWVYIPFGGRGDAPPWHGWIVGVDTRHPDAPQRLFSASTNTDGAGIWSAGGLSVDAAGRLYGVTGNGIFDLDKGGDNLSQTVFRLDTNGDLKFSHDKQDYYTPTNYQHLDDEDEDLGGATALVLPDQPDTSTPHVLFTGGKDGVAYLLNRDNLGGLGSELQKTPFFVDPNAEYQEGIRTTSAYFDGGAAGRFVYVVGDGNGEGGGPGTVALQLAPETPGGPLRFKKAWYSRGDVGRPTSPTVSSDGSSGGIVWETELGGDKSFLRALDAVTGKDIYTSRKGSMMDHIFAGQSFVSPIIANGRVFVGGHGIFCYGLKTSIAKGGGQ